MKKDNGFKVPENYFEKNKREILRQTTGQKKYPFKKYMPYLAAACVGIVFTVVSLNYSTPEDLDPDITYLVLVDDMDDNLNDIYFEDMSDF